MSVLLDKQFLFTRLTPRLLDYIHSQALECTFGETWRTPEQAALNAKKGLGIANSLHIVRLAVDLNLFTKDGKWLQTFKDYEPIGLWWIEQDPLCRWGGRFAKPDPGHFSITHEGRA